MFSERTRTHDTPPSDPPTHSTQLDSGEETAHRFEHSLFFYCFSRCSFQLILYTRFYLSQLLSVFVYRRDQTTTWSLSIFNSLHKALFFAHFTHSLSRCIFYPRFFLTLSLLFLLPTLLSMPQQQAQLDKLLTTEATVRLVLLSGFVLILH